MISSSKNIFSGKINDKGVVDYLVELDWSISDQSERLRVVNEILTGDDLFSVYFSEFYNPKLSADDDLSENNFVAQGLSIIADYLLMGSEKMKPNEIIKNNEQDNYYKSNATKVMASDFKNKNYGIVLTAYEGLKTAVRKSPETKTKQDKLIGEINKDMVVAKDCLQRPIKLQGNPGGSGNICWLNCDYTDVTQVKQLLRIKPRGVFSDLGVLTYDMEQVIKQLNLTKSEKKILSAVRNNGENTMQNIGDEAKCSRQFVDKVLNKIAQKIVDYEKNFS